VHARAGLAQALLDEAERDELDLVVATVRGVRRSVELEPLFDETFALVAAPRWAARIDRAALARDAPAALAGVPLVAYADDLPIVRRYFRAVFGVKPPAPARLVLDDLRGILAAVVAGAGVSVLPGYLVDAPLRAGELVLLFEPRRAPRNTIYLGARPAALRSPRVAAAHTLLLRAAATWSAS
jgi:DNA-binding transcriptional LysR family regulator